MNMKMKINLKNKLSNKKKKGFARYFGPYPNVSAAKEMLNFIKEK